MTKHVIFLLLILKPFHNPQKLSRPQVGFRIISHILCATEQSHISLFSRFVELLHSKGISSFLVTNAQFPSAIRDMVPVTQLYVSIDASTKDALKKIDRPLFKDFWERFIDSLKELERKGQRTVYRLTLVKGWNAEEMDNYAKLVSIGKPDFIEIKGVTYCGTSKGNKLKSNSI